jgi:hypothetical protein
MLICQIAILSSIVPAQPELLTAAALPFCGWLTKKPGSFSADRIAHRIENINTFMEMITSAALPSAKNIEWLTRSGSW